MTTLVFLAQGRVFPVAILFFGGIFLLPMLLRAILGRLSEWRPAESERPMGAATRLRRYRDCRVVKCPRHYCQAMNVQRARFCRHCGAPLA